MLHLFKLNTYLLGSFKAKWRMIRLFLDILKWVERNGMKWSWVKQSFRSIMQSIIKPNKVFILYILFKKVGEMKINYNFFISFLSLLKNILCRSKDKTIKDSYQINLMCHSISSWPNWRGKKNEGKQCNRIDYRCHLLLPLHYLFWIQIPNNRTLCHFTPFQQSGCGFKFFEPTKTRTANRTKAKWNSQKTKFFWMCLGHFLCQLSDLLWFAVFLPTIEPRAYIITKI